MCFLCRGISMGHSGAWFAQPEAQLTEHPLALANPDGNAVPLLNPGTECFSIPEVPAQTNLPRRIAQNLIHRRPLFFRQASGSPRSLPLRQSCQTVSFKTTDPIFHRPWCIAQKMCHLRAGHTKSARSAVRAQVMTPSSTLCSEVIAPFAPPRTLHRRSRYIGPSKSTADPPHLLYSASTMQRKPMVAARSMLGAIKRYFPCSSSLWFCGKYHLDPAGE